MEFDAWSLVTSVTNILSFVAWGFPLIALSLLSYSIQYYTHFRTKWKLFIFAFFLTLSYPAATSYYYLIEGSVTTSLLLISTSLLLMGLILSAYASIQLLSFQKINLGKTKNTIYGLSILSVIIPAIALFTKVISYSDSLHLVEYNLSVSALILVFLSIGKLTQNYIPRYRLLAYSAARLGSMILLVDPILMNYSFLMNVTLTFMYGMRLIGVLCMFLSSILLMIPVIMLILEAQARGVRLLPTREACNENPLKYKLDKGISYILREESQMQSTEIFMEYVTHHHHGLLFTRTRPSRIRHSHNLNLTPILWLTNAQTDEKSVKPQDLDRMVYIIRDFIRFDRESIVMIQRLDYLITENDFKTVLKFIHTLNDLVMESKCVFVVSVNPTTLTQDQMALLLQELEDLTNADKVALGEPLYSVLLFVHTENKRRMTPSFKDITEKFDITKTTARKRIYDLESQNLIKIITQGRYKFLEVTEAGRAVVGSPIHVVKGGQE